MAKEDLPKAVNELTFEIRYKPNAKVLDHRGTWAEQISEHMKLPEWQIVENRVDVFDKDSKNRGFVGFKNAGFVSHDAHTANFFPDQTIKFFKFVLELDGFDSPIFVTRIGVRSKFFTTYEGKFEDLRERYATRFITMTDKAKQIFNAKLIDVGGPLNFADRHGNFNTVSGPMTNTQAQQFFNRTEELPKIGLYLDIDYWQKPEKQMDNRKILETISTFSNEAWRKYEDICNLIMAE